MRLHTKNCVRIFSDFRQLPDVSCEEYNSQIRRYCQRLRKVKNGRKEKVIGKQGGRQKSMRNERLI